VKEDLSVFSPALRGAQTRPAIEFQIMSKLTLVNGRVEKVAGIPQLEMRLLAAVLPTEFR